MINRGIEKLKGDEKPGKALQFKTQIKGEGKSKQTRKKSVQKLGSCTVLLHNRLTARPLIGAVVFKICRDLQRTNQ